MTQALCSPRRHGRTGCILVVDDHRDSADTLVAWLNLSGWKATAAYDGATALASVRVHRPSAVILETRIGPLDGFDLAQQLRRCIPDVPVIAVTSWCDPGHRRRALVAGLYALLLKPADLSVLASLLRAAVRAVHAVRNDDAHSRRAHAM